MSSTLLGLIEIRAVMRHPKVTLWLKNARAYVHATQEMLNVKAMIE